jgi:hypothetical protein
MTVDKAGEGPIYLPGSYLAKPNNGSGCNVKPVINKNRIVTRAASKPVLL